MQTASFSPPLICTPALSTKEKARPGSMDTDSAPVCHRKRKGGREGRRWVGLLLLLVSRGTFF